MIEATPLEQLQLECNQLRAEVRILSRQLLQAQMEKAIRDEACSREIVADIGRFYEAPISPLFMMILFFAEPPKQAHHLGQGGKNPIYAVEKVFSKALQNHGQTFFFTAPGSVACLLNVYASTIHDCDEGELETKECQIYHDLLAAITDAPQDTGTAYICLSRLSQLLEGPRLPYRGACVVAEHRTSQSLPVCGEWELGIGPALEQKDIYRLEMQFWQQLQQQAFYEAAGTLEQIIEASSFQQGSLERTRGIVFSRLEIVLQTCGQNSGKDMMKDPDFSALMPALTRAENYQTLLEYTYDILALLEDKFYTPANERNRKMVAVEKYIAEHYSDPELGPAVLSEQFKISNSYLSRIFKADMGTSVANYIRQTRIEASKRLMKETQLSINDIAQQVGFSNHWVFIRAFKRQENMTPGNYRDMVL